MSINAEWVNAGERERDDLQYLELNHQKQCEVNILVLNHAQRVFNVTCSMFDSTWCDVYHIVAAFYAMSVILDIMFSIVVIIMLTVQWLYSGTSPLVRPPH